MRKHTKKCWGDTVVASEDKAKNAKEVWAMTVKGALDPQLITAALERKVKGKVKYSHQQHTKTEPRAQIIQWVAKSKRPFKVATDHGFRVDEDRKAQLLHTFSYYSIPGCQEGFCECA